LPGEFKKFGYVSGCQFSSELRQQRNQNQNFAVFLQGLRTWKT